MLRDPGTASGSPKKIFSGVRFVLFGFDSVSEAQYRSELVNGGGVNVGGYDSSCTHVIVSGRIFQGMIEKYWLQNCGLMTAWTLGCLQIPQRFYTDLLEI